MSDLYCLMRVLFASDQSVVIVKSVTIVLQRKCECI